MIIIIIFAIQLSLLLLPLLLVLVLVLLLCCQFSNLCLIVCLTIYVIKAWIVYTGYGI